MRRISNGVCGIPDRFTPPGSQIPPDVGGRDHGSLHPYISRDPWFPSGVMPWSRCEVHQDAGVASLAEEWANPGEIRGGIRCFPCPLPLPSPEGGARILNLHHHGSALPFLLQFKPAALAQFIAQSSLVNRIFVAFTLYEFLPHFPASCGLGVCGPAGQPTSRALGRQCARQRIHTLFQWIFPSEVSMELVASTIQSLSGRGDSCPLQWPGLALALDGLAPSLVKACHIPGAARRIKWALHYLGPRLPRLIWHQPS